MPTLEFATTVNAPLAKVWAFHEDVRASLPALSPPADEVTIESADLPVRVGSKIVLIAKGPLGRRIRWVAKIVQHVPPHAVVFGEEARFADEQESGPFAFWRHEHEFEAIDSKTTRCVDRLAYRAPFGPIGWIADCLFVRWKLKGMFRYRQDALKRAIEV